MAVIYDIIRVTASQIMNLILIFIFGLIVGSFLNVCIHRILRGQSVMVPRSHCPNCGRYLSLLDLIPLLSFVFLRGRCRYCKKAISWRYPLVELIMGLLMVLLSIKFVGALELCFYTVFVSLLVIALFTDLEEQLIPDVVNFMGIIFGLGFNILRTLEEPSAASLLGFYDSLAGILTGYLAFFLVACLGQLLFKKEALGEGDWYLAALLGAFLGWQGMLVAGFLAYLTAGLAAVILLMAGKVKMGGYVPFGPALVIGGLISLFYGQALLAWYVGLLVR